MNDSVRQAREVALDILKPTQKQLEHGLELHHDALVIESYGFSPRAAIDSEAIIALIAEGASDVEVRETWEDMNLTRMVSNAALRKEYQEAFDYAGVDCILQNAGEEGQDPTQMIKRLGNFTHIMDMLSDFMQRAPTPDDIVRAKEQGKHSLYLTTNGVPMVQRWRTVEEEMRFIRVFFQLGVRMMHLTYNRRNMLGDGCQEKNDGGVSNFGEAVIREMNRVGVIVDVAHSGDITSREAAEISEKPIMASHSGARALSGHLRFKSDETIRAIVDRGGLVGVCAVPSFLGGSGDIAAFLDHIEYIKNKFGAHATAIGTDTAYHPPQLEEEGRKVPPRGKSRTRFSGFWQPKDPILSERWKDPRMRQSLAWTNWPIFTVGMVQRGFSDEDIRKILGGNVLRVARAVFPKYER